jgi:hypothetical protein
MFSLWKSTKTVGENNMKILHGVKNIKEAVNSLTENGVEFDDNKIMYFHSIDVYKFYEDGEPTALYFSDASSLYYKFKNKESMNNVGGNAYEKSNR